MVGVSASLRAAGGLVGTLTGSASKHSPRGPGAEPAPADCFRECRPAERLHWGMNP